MKVEKLLIGALIVIGIATVVGIHASKKNASNEEIQQEEITVPEMSYNGSQTSDVQHNTAENRNGKPTNKKNKSGNSRLMELPATKQGETIIKHTAYTLSFNTKHNNPNWVAWELTANEANANMQRSDNFCADPELPLRNQVTSADYKGSGYDRGHMCPAADNRWSTQAMNECFYMSNMCPQNHELNSQSWERLESACRRWATNEGSIFIVCGPIYKSNRKSLTIGYDHVVTVPDEFFKCVLTLNPGKEKAIGFIYSNRQGKQSMEECAMTVDDVEAITGYDFFVNLDNKLESRLESSYDLSKWK